MNEPIEMANALADGELTENEAVAVGQAIAGDEKLAAEHEWALLLKQQLKEKLPAIHDEETWRLCQRRLDEIDQANRVQSFVGRYAWAFCALFLAGILVAAGMNRMNPNRPLGTEHVAGLLNGLQARGSTGELVDELHALTGGKSSAIRNAAKVVGGASGYVDGRRAVKLVLEDSRGYLNLFVVQAAGSLEGLDAQESDYKCGSINDSQAISWSERGCLMILVAPRNTADLQQVAESIRRVR